jgi:hypothetical protein
VKQITNIDFVSLTVDTVRGVLIMSYRYMDHYYQIFCLNCRATSTVQYNGVEGYCLGCGTRGVLHRCPDANSISQPFWMPIYEAAVDAVCPWCAPVRRVGEHLAASKEAPEWVRALGNLAIGVVAVAGPVLLAKVVLDSVLDSTRD